MNDAPDTDHDHPTRPARRRRLPAPAVTLALAVLVGGATAFAVARGGGEDPSSGAAGERSPQEEAALAFADCMRDNGIDDFPDPSVDEDGGISIGDALADQRDTAAFRTAEDACEPLLDAAAPAGPELPADEVADLQEQWRAVAECVRAQGHELEDPHVDEHGRPQVDAGSPEVEQAIEECFQQSDLGRPPGAGT